MGDLLWPTYEGPHDVAAIEAVPLADRGLPGTTYELLVRAAALWPDRLALSVLRGRRTVAATGGANLRPAARRRAPLRQRASGVGRASHGRRRPPRAQLRRARHRDPRGAARGHRCPDRTAGSSPQHLTELLRRSGARVLVAAGPDLAPEVWDTARDLAVEAGMEALLALRPTGPARSGVGAAPGRGRARRVPVSTGCRSSPPTPSPVQLPAAADLAALFHTGGTTGTPKLAAHTHANEVGDAWMIAATRLLHEEAVVFAALPLFHVNALLVTVLAPAVQGSSSHLGRPPGLP